MGYEEEKLWKKDWQPPQELLGPNAHKLSNLAGKKYKTALKKQPTVKSPTNKPSKSVNSVSAAAVTAALLTPIATLQQQLNQNSLLLNLPPPQPEPVVNEKDRILFALQFGQRSDIEWALNQIVTISFESPEKLEINNSAFLLQLLVSLARPCLTTHAADNALPTSARDTLDHMMTSESDAQITAATSPTSTATSTSFSTDFGTLDIILKVLHIIRNLSFIPAYAPTLAENESIMKLLIQVINTSMSTGHVELGRHSLDVMENIASHLVLKSAEDPWLVCIYKTVAAHDRYLAIGSLRTLTLLTMNKANHPHLESCSVLACIAQMLLSNDEELVGTVLEYLYQYTRVSLDCRTRFMSVPHLSVYISLLVSILTVKSKYFCTRFFVQDEVTTPNPQKQQQQQVTPRVPDLTVYHNLDEPFRCLGWVKDKFEAADRSSILSLDDIYLLYEARFGLEKALKMRDFYTVMKIAFPKASTESNNLLGSPGQSAPVVEGLDIVGIQIKMNILQDRKLHIYTRFASIY